MNINRLVGKCDTLDLRVKVNIHTDISSLPNLQRFGDKQCRMKQSSVKGYASPVDER